MGECGCCCGCPRGWEAGGGPGCHYFCLRPGQPALGRKWCPRNPNPQETLCARGRRTICLMGSVPFLCFRYSIFLMVIKYHFKCMFFFGLFITVTFWGTNSPASGVIYIWKRSWDLFPLSIVNSWPHLDLMGEGRQRVSVGLESSIAVVIQVSLAVRFYIEQWGFGAEWMVEGGRWQIIGAVLCKLFNQNLSAVSEL